MSEYLYEVWTNGAGSIMKHRILKETPKTYVLDRVCNKIIRKETMQDNYSLYYIDEEKAKECLNGIRRRYEQNSIAIRPRLACAPGDTVYQVIDWEIYERKILYIRVYEGENRYVYDEQYGDYCYIAEGEFNKTAFVLKEDAEDAVKKT